LKLIKEGTMNRKLAILLAMSAFAATAAAQDIYRCGDSYSQKPCPGGRLVETEDARSAKQASESRLASQRDAKVADAMEKARLKEEAKPAQVAMPPQKVQASARAEKKPAPFTAISPPKPGETAVKTKGKKKKTKKQDA